MELSKLRLHSFSLSRREAAMHLNRGNTKSASENIFLYDSPSRENVILIYSCRINLFRFKLSQWSCLVAEIAKNRIANLIWFSRYAGCFGVAAMFCIHELMHQKFKWVLENVQWAQMANRGNSNQTREIMWKCTRIQSYSTMKISLGRETFFQPFFCSMQVSLAFLSSVEVFRVLSLSRLEHDLWCFVFCAIKMFRVFWSLPSGG